MHVTLRQLKVFESVARLLSYTRAAEELCLTQPAVSMQIKQLEGNVGLALFEQLGKKIYLTHAGNEINGYAKAILQLLIEAENVVEDLKGLRQGMLEISVATTANDFAARLLAAFSRENSEIKYHLDVTNRATLLDQLEKNVKDIVIMGSPPAELDLDAIPFMDNPLVVIAAPGHVLAEQKKIPFMRLIEETFVMRERGSGTRIAMERFFAKEGTHLVASMEMSSNESIKQAVQAGLGLGIVSMHTVPLELETGRLCILDVEHFPILRHWYVVHRKTKRLSVVARAFKDFVLTRSKEFSHIG